MSRVQNMLVLLLTVVSLGLWIYTGVHPHDIKPFLLYGAYYGMFSLFFMWVYTLVRCLEVQPFSIASFLRQYRSGLLFCLFLTLVIVGSVKPSFKTLGDETNLLSTSHAMVFGKKCASELMGIRSFGNFDAIATAIDQRPFLFPYLTSILHTLRGYEANNAFLLNGLLMFLFFSVVYVGARQYFNWRISAAAALLVASTPIFSICGTSGGFDLLSTFCFALSLVALYVYLKEPTNEKFAFLWMTLLLLAHTRYESFIFFFVILGLLAVMRSLKGSMFKSNKILIALTPLWLLIIAWGRLVNSDFVQDPEVQHLFGASYFESNLLDMIKGQLDFQFHLPYNNVLNLLALLLAVYLFWVIVVRRKAFQRPDQRRWALIATVSTAIYMAIVLSHFAGAYSSHTNARYYLLFSVICALMPLFGLGTLSEETLSKLSTPILLLSIGLFSLYHPIAVEGRFINRIGPNLEIYFAHDFLKEHYPDKRVLVIAEWPSEYTALEYGAMSYYTANAAYPRVLSSLQRHLFQDIVIIQRIAYATGSPVAEDALNPVYPLETLSEYETYDDSFIRISRVKVPTLGTRGS